MAGITFAVPGQLTNEEPAAHERLPRAAPECLQQEGDTEDLVDTSGAERVVGYDWAVAPNALSAQRSTVSRMAVMPEPLCIHLSQPIEAAVQRNQLATTLMRSCLDDAGLPYQLVSGPFGITQVVPEASPVRVATWEECVLSAHAEALERFTAAPALLYTGTVERFDPFSGDGMWRTALTALAVLAVAAAVTILVGSRLARPVRTLTAAVQRIASGDRTARVPVSGYDDVARLGRAFNEMAKSIDAGERQRKAMVSDVAHELRTPLANVRGYLEAAQDGVVPVDPDLIRLLRDESTTLQRLVDDLQDLALADAGVLRPHSEHCDLAELARQVVAGNRARAGETGVALTLDAPTPVMVGGDPVRLRQAIGNLVANAVQYTPAEGDVQVTVAAGADGAEVSVRDTGPGIAAAHLPHVFDRFYRAEGSRSRATGGSGLGLAVTRHLVEAHGGSVDVASQLGEGSTFTVRLPTPSALIMGERAHSPAEYRTSPMINAD